MARAFLHHRPLGVCIALERGNGGVQCLTMALRRLAA